MIRLSLVILIVLISKPIIGCAENSYMSNIIEYTVKTKIIYYNFSKTYELIILGNMINNKLFPVNISVKKVGDNNKELKYNPIDQSSLETSAFDFSHAWAPNGNILVLPRGRFEGFEAFSTEHLIENIKKRNGKSIAISDASGAMFWHDFIGWKDDSTIVFTAGLSNKNFGFEWNIENGDLISLELKTGKYRVLTKN